jgi:CheY-like chemotaxis protein
MMTGFKATPSVPQACAPKVILPPQVESRFTPVEFDQIVEWACLGAAQSRTNMACVALHRQKLMNFPGTEEGLAQFSQGIKSKAFTEPQRIALCLSKSISSEPPEGLLELLTEAQHYFNSDEVVRLSSAILAVNDWVDLHSPSPLRILIIEDNIDDQRLLSRQLSEAKLNEGVMFISDGLQALDLIESTGEVRKTGLIAIFLDLSLPRVNGLQLLQRLRNQPGGESFPVIVMTSSNSPADLEACEKLNVTGYVQKPVTFQSFSHAIANLFHSL